MNVKTNRDSGRIHFCFPIILLRLQLWLALSTDLPNLILRCSAVFNLLSYSYFRAAVF